MISVQRLDLDRTLHLHLHLPLPHPEAGREGMVTPLREMSATSIGIPVSVTGGLIAHLDIRTPIHNLATQTLPVEPKMRKMLRTQLWNFSLWTT